MHRYEYKQWAHLDSCLAVFVAFLSVFSTPLPCSFEQSCNFEPKQTNEHGNQLNNKHNYHAKYNFYLTVS